jgi:hypothetical protein
LALGLGPALLIRQLRYVSGDPPRFVTDEWLHRLDAAERQAIERKMRDEGRL